MTQGDVGYGVHKCMGTHSTKGLSEGEGRAISGVMRTHVTGREMKGRDSG